MAGHNSWLPLRCDGRTSELAYKLEKNIDGYIFSVTDSIHIFTESLGNAEIENRCSDLNPAIEEALASDLIDELIDMIGDKTTYIEMTKPKGTGILIACQGKLYGYDFQWKFHLDRESAEHFHDHLSKDLLNMVGYLFEREKFLIQQLRDKDLEISDYQSSGGTLTRKSLKTEPFSEEALSQVKSPLMKSIKVLTTEEFSSTLELIHKHRKANDKAPSTPTSSKKDRKKRIKIKGMQVSDMLKSDDERDSNDSEDEPPKKKPSPKVPQSNHVHTQNDPTIQAKKNVKKRLKKL